MADDRAQLTVTQALLAVMKDVGAIRKGERNKDQGFNFRGIDTITNASQPEFIKHGVHVRPIAETIQFEHYTTSRGTNMRNCVVKMRYVFTGPGGDTIEASTFGEAADAGDKSVSKAQSVAFRVALLQALMIPTDEPEPDAQAHQRGAPSHTVPSFPEGSARAKYARAAQALSGPDRAALRAELAKRNMPSLVNEMSDEEADLALGVLADMMTSSKEPAS